MFRLLFPCGRGVSRSHLFVVLVLVVNLCLHCCIEARELKFVAILHRHGDRAPAAAYKTDPHRNHKWPGGYGSLSPKGELQLYTMGRHLRPRYADLLPADGFFSVENMRVMSSHLNRCMMSTQSLIAGLLETGSLNTLPIRWQPVAITTIPAEKDNMIYQFGYSCLRYDALYNRLIDATEPDPESDMYKFNADNKADFEYLSESTGENITNVAHALFLDDVLLVQEDNKLKLPAWTQEVYPKMLHSARLRAFQLFTETPYMKHVRGGPLLTDVLQQMKEKANGTLERKIAIYSGHDATVFNMLRTLGVTEFNDDTPDYGATLAFELHCGDAKECIVRILYNPNTYVQQPTQLRIANCRNPCTLRQFERAISKYLITDMAKLCALPDPIEDPAPIDTIDDNVPVDTIDDNVPIDDIEDNVPIDETPIGSFEKAAIDTFEGAAIGAIEGAAGIASAHAAAHEVANDAALGAARALGQAAGNVAGRATGRANTRRNKLGAFNPLGGFGI